MGRIGARVALTALAAALVAGISLANPPHRQRLGYTDLTGVFADAYDRAEGDEALSLAYYNNVFSGVLPRLYDPVRYGPNADRYREVTRQFLSTYPEQRGAIAQVAKRFGKMFDPAVADFERRIGPLPVDTPVFLMVSMGEFDGATRYFGGREYLLFGADMIAKIHPGDARPFVQHELFHIYHNAKLGDCFGLYCNLWTEGLATYAALSLNPDATDADLLLTIPEPIRPALVANRREAICVTLQHLDSRDIRVFNTLFSGARMNERLPPRFGYMVGLWVAQELGKDHSLNDMASWSGPELRATVERGLRSMADCSRPLPD